MRPAYLNAVATAVPDFDVHEKFVRFCPRLLPDERSRRLFERMAKRAQVEHRYSFLRPHPDSERLDSEGFYDLEAFPDTAERMRFYERHAFSLARRALDQLDLNGVTHLLATNCTGFYAPGLDLQVLGHYGLPDSVERSMIGFMGCYAALNALKLARHIVRSEPHARVLILSLELCTLHLKPGGTLEEMLSFLIFADGCAAGIVTTSPEGLELRDFGTAVLPQAAEQITWRIGDGGFDMRLSGQVPATIAAALPARLGGILGDWKRDDVASWAVHPGGRSVLDAVREGAGLEEEQLAASREVLRNYGNMSSPSLLFVLEALMRRPGGDGPGCAMAFGPGLTVESMRFWKPAA